MSFTFSTLPPIALFPKPVQTIARKYDEAADTLAKHQMQHGVVNGQDARQAALDADNALMAQALRAGASGEDLGRIGEPNESARLALVRAHAHAIEVATTQALDAQLALAAAIAENRDAIIATARTAVTADAEKYATDVAVWADSRRAMNLSLEALLWAFRIDGGRDIPNYGSDPTPAFVGQFTTMNESEVLALLLDDTKRLEQAEKVEERRNWQAQENARADAANAALAGSHNAARAGMAAQGL